MKYLYNTKTYTRFLSVFQKIVSTCFSKLFSHLKYEEF